MHAGVLLCQSPHELRLRYVWPPRSRPWHGPVSATLLNRPWHARGRCSHRWERSNEGVMCEAEIVPREQQAGSRNLFWNLSVAVPHAWPPYSSAEHLAGRELRCIWATGLSPHREAWH